jgi:hypothetical protein
LEGLFFKSGFHEFRKICIEALFLFSAGFFDAERSLDMAYDSSRHRIVMGEEAWE